MWNLMELLSFKLTKGPTKILKKNRTEKRYFIPQNDGTSSHEKHVSMFLEICEFLQFSRKEVTDDKIILEENEFESVES